MGVFDSLGGYSSSIMSYATTTAFWIAVMFIIAGAFFLILKIRMARKLNKVVLNMIDLGDGRFDFQVTKGGWLKSKRTFFGLLDYGNEQRFYLKDKRFVDGVSQNDYRYVNNKLALVIVTNPHDSKLCYPISRFYLSKNSKVILSEVAPSDYRDSAEKCIEQVDLEMQNKWQQYAPMIIIGLVIMITLIITLLNTQYGKHMVDQATATILEIRNTPCSAVPSAVAGSGAI